MSSELTLTFKLGDLIANRYKIVKELRAGSMGVVYVCQHHEFYDRLVAVKILFPYIAKDKVACARLYQEITASYLVTNINVVRTYEFIRTDSLIGYSMEYVEGEDLAEKLEREKQLPPLDVADILRQICVGVQAIYSAGLVHRDLRPENILIKKNGLIKITDFGIVHVKNAPRITEKGGVVGNLAYMSPEYLKSGEVDWRSDIYAIGVLGYKMLTGVTPISSTSVVDYVQKCVTNEIDPITKSVPNCPPSLEKIILKALEVDPQKRYQSALAMQCDLNEFIHAETGQITKTYLNSDIIPSGMNLSSYFSPSINDDSTSKPLEEDLQAPILVQDHDLRKTIVKPFKAEGGVERYDQQLSPDITPSQPLDLADNGEVEISTLYANDTITEE
ncbi:MAG: serine/threonine protein kinase [Bdellovibrionota bacterium]